MVVRRNRGIGVLRGARQSGLLERVACKRNLARPSANRGSIAREHRSAGDGAARGVVQAVERNAVCLAEGFVDVVEFECEIVALSARLRQIGEDLVDGASLTRRSHGLVALFGNRPFSGNGGNHAFDFKIGRSRKHVVGLLRRFGKNRIDDDLETNAGQVFFDLGGIGPIGSGVTLNEQRHVGSALGSSAQSFLAARNAQLASLGDAVAGSGDLRERRVLENVLVNSGNLRQEHAARLVHRTEHGVEQNRATNGLEAR